MSDAPKIVFAKPEAPEGGTLIVLADDGLAFGPRTRALLAGALDLVSRAAAIERFKGKLGSTLDIIAPAGLAVDRLIVIGTGKVADLTTADFNRIGGVAQGRIPSAAKEATLVAELPSGEIGADNTAEIALGMRLRAYSFDRYKTKKKDEDEPAKAKVTIGTAEESAAKKAWKAREAVAEGVVLARDLVNEPPNVLFPAEFARRCEKLSELGVEVDVLDEREMKKLGMGALLGVGQGSEHESKIVLMRWRGSKDHDHPVAFIGKGVCFDTGGISIKPAASMEDMKGDMGGAAAVVGLMHALAARKAKVDVIGAIGLVENMPDGKAQRPGDIVTSMSGQTIEIINTDAEGRLVLADVLWYVKETYKPRFMIDLATLTGAIMVALGQEHAGLFSNDDVLADKLLAAGKATGERVWRMPLGTEYDKMIDSKFADMKNTGGRNGGSITAAQFLKRFVDEVPWAHLDIAGTAFASPQSDINKSWGSGYGVRLLDRLVKDGFEG